MPDDDGTPQEVVTNPLRILRELAPVKPRKSGPRPPDLPADWVLAVNGTLAGGVPAYARGIRVVADLATVVDYLFAADQKRGFDLCTQWNGQVAGGVARSLSRELTEGASAQHVANFSADLDRRFAPLRRDDLRSLTKKASELASRLENSSEPLATELYAFLKHDLIPLLTRSDETGLLLVRYATIAEMTMRARSSAAMLLVAQDEKVDTRATYDGAVLALILEFAIATVGLLVPVLGPVAFVTSVVRSLDAFKGELDTLEALERSAPRGELMPGPAADRAQRADAEEE